MKKRQKKTEKHIKQVEGTLEKHQCPKRQRKAEERRNSLNCLEHILFSGSIIGTGNTNMNKTKALCQGENLTVYYLIIPLRLLRNKYDSHQYLIT